MKSFESFVPETERIPGVLQKASLQRQGGLASLPQRILLIGWRGRGDPDDDTVDDLDYTATRVRTRSQAQAVARAGSQLDLMARAAFASGALAQRDKRKRGGTPEVFVMPLPPPDSETDKAAIRNVVLDGTADNAGPVTGFVAGETVTIQVARGDALSVIAGRLAAALELRSPELPFIATAEGSQLTLSAREKGAWGNELVCRIDTSQIAGLKATVSAGVEGVGLLDLAPALAASLTDDWDAVIVPQDDPATRALLRPHIQQAWDFTRRRYRIVITAQGGDFSDAQTAAAEIDDWRVVVAHAERISSTEAPELFDFKHSARSFSFEVAAAVGARLFSQGRANYNFNRASLPVFGRPRTVNRDALNETINAGVTVVIVPEKSQYPGAFVRPVSCAVTDQTGQTKASDRTWQPIEIAKTVALVLRQMDLELNGFTEAEEGSADEETRISAIAAAFAVLRNAESQRLIANIDNDSVIAKYQLVGGATHLVVALAYGVRTGIDIIAVEHNISRAV